MDAQLRSILVSLSLSFTHTHTRTPLHTQSPIVREHMSSFTGTYVHKYRALAPSLEWSQAGDVSYPSSQPTYTLSRRAARPCSKTGTPESRAPKPFTGSCWPAPARSSPAHVGSRAPGPCAPTAPTRCLRRGSEAPWPTGAATPSRGAELLPPLPPPRSQPLPAPSPPPPRVPAPAPALGGRRAPGRPGLREAGPLPRSPERAAHRPPPQLDEQGPQTQQPPARAPNPPHPTPRRLYQARGTGPAGARPARPCAQGSGGAGARRGREGPRPSGLAFPGVSAVLDSLPTPR